MRKLFLLLVIFPSFLFGQTSKKDSLWLPLKPFIGQWAGEGGGGPGKGKYERSYQFILNKNFIEIRNKSMFQPTDRNPKGEVHEDIGYFSYDKSAKKFKLRQFHIEGFVNEYVLDSISADKKTIVFLTCAIENIPKGWKAKETYRLLSENEIEETFELAEPDKNFEVYSRVKLIRQK
jgi:hypothetical protein